MTDGDELDQSLVRRAQSGDEAAFTSLIERYKGPILGFVYRMIGDASEAEDVAQEAFVRAYRHLDRFTVRGPGDSFSSWMFQLARNVAIDELRRRRRRPVSFLDDDSGGEAASAGADPAREAAGRERERVIAAAVGELPEDQRTALVLAVYEDRSYAEIAAIMKSSEKSVESRLYRARQFLRRRLAELLQVCP